ncbi:hypothetical protein ACWCY6_16030 [Streptomyces sp. 900105755]
MSPHTEAGPAEPAVERANAAVLRRFPSDDTRDLEDARRGFLGTAQDSVVKDPDGRVVWDLGAYGLSRADATASGTATTPLAPPSQT